MYQRARKQYPDIARRIGYLNYFFFFCFFSAVITISSAEYRFNSPPVMVKNEFTKHIPIIRPINATTPI
jgi:hypothetical protein